MLIYLTFLTKKTTEYTVKHFNASIWKLAFIYNIIALEIKI